LFPRSGGARWQALRYQALGDGIMDAAVARRGEMAKPRDEARDDYMARQKAVVAGAGRTGKAVPHKLADIGSITVACALGYLDFRFAAEPWRRRIRNSPPGTRRFRHTRHRSDSTDGSAAGA